jgi:sodium-dependent phosphate cotransporter
MFCYFQLDRNAINDIALGIASPDVSLLKRYCSYKNESNNGTFIQIPDQYCSFLFAKLSWPDWSIGLLLLIVSIICLCFCLILLVKILQSLLKGTVKHLIFKMVNSNFPGIFKYLTPYLAILVNILNNISK